MATIYDHETGHTVYLAGLIDGKGEVRVSLDDGIFYVQSQPTAFEVGGPSAMISELLAGMAMECATDGVFPQTYKELREASQFGEYDIDLINDLVVMGMVHRETLDELSRDLVVGMAATLKHHGSGVSTFKKAISQIGESEHESFRAATVH